MKPMIDIEQALNVQELRARFLKYTREAYRLLPTFHRPRILDIGCGQGLPTIELARLSEGKIVGIDTDNVALSKFQQHIEQANLSHQITVVNRSLYTTGFPDESFDILWEEGALNLLDHSRSFPECNRLLKPRGFLVMHESTSWFDEARERISEFGFVSTNQHLLPKHCWWTEYGAPLQDRIRAFRKAHDDSVESANLSQYEHEVAILKEDPSQLDCGFFIIQKRS